MSTKTRRIDEMKRNNTGKYEALLSSLITSASVEGTEQNIPNKETRRDRDGLPKRGKSIAIIIK